MTIKETTSNRLIEKWFACKVTSGRKSAGYGLRFSYPLYIAIVAIGIYSVNPFILSSAALIALFGAVLPMHPFDYIYNNVVTKLIRTEPIPGRGTESQFSSTVALIFNFFVIASIIFGFQLNYAVMVIAYVLSSLFFIAVQLSTDNFSFYSFFSLLKKNK